jgi:uncharacterized protein
MDTKTRLQTDLNEAMKSQNAAVRDTLRLMMAAIKQAEVDSRQSLDENGVQEVLLKQAKQRRESIAEYGKGGRDDLVAKEQAELAIIDQYLPQMMSAEEVATLAQQAIAETGATSAKQMGAVMSKLMPKVKGKADGKLVNEVVNDLLGQIGNL